ncbi:multiple sugar transport system ATP-binding protein [Raineyella antarctica]|uniref:Multiple sugar transport system ATP-binding protein n=1 Tax=Raineyella antarctica TaxID=1577474 RepID=A0A1G6HNB9_9ACTN|nr:ATP-binding cassette domain-containing protein [Raineyella antarctica]SDB95740.1 multiple sugar transport system ATP-binding protein [Raineyella antarctica]
MATVEFREASRIFDTMSRPAVNRINLDIADGEFLVLVGPSGCGKSTTLRMLAGLEPVDQGQILIDGVDVTDKRARDRDCAMVFQSYALYPNMTARQNMSFALENARMPKAQITEKVAAAAKMLELEDLLDRKPAKMSGGQRQRIAMGRAIVRDPKVFCMDEPLSNLDAKLRVTTRSQIATLQRRLGVTTVYVTHDQTEAMTMGDRVCVLKDGEIQQVDRPTFLYEHPANTFVAGFIGSPAITLIENVEVSGSRAVMGEGHRMELGMDPVLASRTPGRVIVGIRPEGWEVLSEDDGSTVPLRVDLIEELGSESFAYCTPLMTADSPVTVRNSRVTVRAGKRQKLSVGETIHVRPGPDEASFFHPESEVNLEFLEG